MNTYQNVKKMETNKHLGKEEYDLSVSLIGEKQTNMIIKKVLISSKQNESIKDNGSNKKEDLGLTQNEIDKWNVKFKKLKESNKELKPA